MFSSDVLPAPLGPMIERMRPRGTSSEMSWAAVTPPNFFDTPSTTSWLSPPGAGARRADVPAMTPPYSRSYSSLLPPSCRLPWANATNPPKLRTLPARACAMPRHVVCLTFDHDHMSGFIARGLTTPTYISRGEYDMVVI